MFDRHRIKDVRQRNGDECANAFDECGIREPAIEDVRCTKRKEQAFIVERGGRDDRRETRQFGELDSCVKCEAGACWTGMQVDVVT